MTENNIKTKQPVVAIIGNGNVASHLHMALSGKAVLYSVNPHTFDGMPGNSADVTLISVKDNAIEEVAKKMPAGHGIVAHTSGSVPMSILKRYADNHGVFYPLQTFTKGAPLEYSEIPFFIEGNTPATTDALKKLARLISGNVNEANSDDRKYLHLASVFACNFTNCLVGIADKILKGKGIDYKVLLPLLRQTISKLETITPEEAQTGPAARKDYPVIDSHLDILRKEYGDDLADIYAALTRRIILSPTH